MIKKEHKILLIDPLSTSFTPRAPPAIHQPWNAGSPGKIMVGTTKPPSWGLPGSRSPTLLLICLHWSWARVPPRIHPEHEHEHWMKSSLYFIIPLRSDVSGRPPAICSEDSLDGYDYFHIANISQLVPLNKFPQSSSLVFDHPSFSVAIIHASVYCLSFLFNFHCSRLICTNQWLLHS